MGKFGFFSQSRILRAMLSRPYASISSAESLYIGSQATMSQCCSAPSARKLLGSLAISRHLLLRRSLSMSMNMARYSSNGRPKNAIYGILYSVLILLRSLQTLFHDGHWRIVAHGASVVCVPSQSSATSWTSQRPWWCRHEVHGEHDGNPLLWRTSLGRFCLSEANPIGSQFLVLPDQRFRCLPRWGLL